MLKTIYPYVLLRPIHTEPKTKSGIILVSHEVSRLLRGKAGSDSIFDWQAIVEYAPAKTGLKAGETIVYERFNAQKVTDNLITIDFNDILAVLE